MTQRELIEFLTLVEPLKHRLRHAWGADGRQESVAEHSWRLCLMAELLREEFPDTDMNKVIAMGLVHDFGEAITGDIPSFYKTDAHEQEEEKAVESLLAKLPPAVRSRFSNLFAEMEELSTPEAKLWKALDNLEAVLTHNEAPLSSWIELEYTENIRYGEENVAFSPWMQALKAELNADSRKKIEEEKISEAFS